MSIIEKLIDLIIGISWPALIGILIIRYEKEIIELLKRIKKIHGVDFDQPGDQENINVDQKLETEIPKNTKSKELATEGYIKVKRYIESELGKIDEPHKIPLLIHNLVIARVYVIYDSIYTVIFGSQLKLLKLLYKHGNCTTEGAKIIYSQSNLIPSSSYDFNVWLGFLKNHKLIDIKEQQIKITPDGKSFYSYILCKWGEANKPW